MSDPRRLSAREGMGGNLLRSARGDAPSDAVRRRTAIALGLAAGASAASATATVTAAAAPASKVGAYGGVGLLVKWIGVGAVGGAMAIGAVTYVAPTLVAPVARATKVSAPASAPPPEARPRAGAEASPPVAPADRAAPASASTETPPIAQPPPPSAPPRSVPRSVGPQASSSSLADELRDLDRAEAALAAGDPRQALDALDAHDRDFKGGALSQEADVIRIEALAASGDAAAASTRARAFLTRFPDGAQADHVRSVLGAIESKNKP